MSTVDDHDALARLAPFVGDLPILSESPVVAGGTTSWHRQWPLLAEQSMTGGQTPR
jgi:hypothetical protein